MNTTGNLTTSEAQSNLCDFPQRGEGARIAKIFAYSLIMLVAFVGNILVIGVVYKNRNMRRTINYFIVNISVSDLLVPLVVMPRILVELILKTPTHSWLLGGNIGIASCKIVYFLSDISPAVSILSLIFMTVDRFVAVVFPLRLHLITSRRRYMLLIATWVISACFTSPLLYGMKLFTFQTPTGKEFYCALDWRPAFDHFESQKAYITTLSIVFLVIPFLLLSLLYSVILLKARAQSNLQRHRSAAGRRSEQQASRRLTLMALTIVAVFGICWGPINVIFFLLAFVWKFRFPTFCGWESVILAAQFLGYSNAAINPCVYFLLIKNFRGGLKNIFQSFKKESNRRGRTGKTNTTETIVRLRRHSNEDILLRDESTFNTI